MRIHINNYFYFFVLSLFIIPHVVFAGAIANANQCLQELQADVGTYCGNSDSLAVTMQNTCNKKISVQLCLEGRDGKIILCGSDHELDPGKTIFQYTCSSTGFYHYWGCTDTTQGGNCGGDNLQGLRLSR